MASELTGDEGLDERLKGQFSNGTEKVVQRIWATSEKPEL
jgi:hypothetical protein